MATTNILDAGLNVIGTNVDGVINFPGASTVSATFSTAETKVITVVDGIITAIA